MTLPTNPVQAVGDPAQPGLRRPLLTLTAAAKAAGVSRSTLRRRLAGGAFPNAVRDEAGSWVVPVEDLLGAGLRLGRPIVPSEQGHDAVSVVSEQGGRRPVDGVFSDRVHELETLLRVEQERRAAAERVAEERERHLGTALAALRMLEAGPGTDNGAVAKRPGWWARRRRGARAGSGPPATSSR